MRNVLASPSRLRTPRRAAPGARALRFLSDHRYILVVLTAFVASAFVVPTLTHAALWDDWVYVRSVETSIQRHSLFVHELSVATAAFQVIWGALFSIFGLTLGTLRVSVVTLSLLGTLALYGLCRELRIDKFRAAACAALFAFNPLTYVLSFSFMTDAPFTSLLCIAAYFYVKGLRPAVTDTRWIVAGSVVAAMATLVREQGVLIPIGVATYLVIAGRIRFDLPSLKFLLSVGGGPLAATIGYTAWQRLGPGVPYWQRTFLSDAIHADYASLGWRITTVTAAYLGLAALPIALATLPQLRHVVTRISKAGWVTFATAGAITAGMLLALLRHGGSMPFSESWWGPVGVGPRDLIYSRPVALGPTVLTWLTDAAIFGAFFLILIVASSVKASRHGASARGAIGPAGCILAIVIWQFIGTFPPSAHFTILLDRYLLPLFPLVLCLVFYALRGVRIWAGVLVGLLAALAFYSVVETRNWLVMEGKVWQVAEGLHRSGVGYNQIEAGAAWDGYHTYDQARLKGEHAVALPFQPWWLWSWDLPIDGTYVVAMGPYPGYHVVSKQEVSQWFHHDKVFMFILKRDTPIP